MVTIAHISDPHVGSPFFVPNLMNRVIVELNEMEPDAVICSGDLTNEGYRQEYKNCAAYFSRIQPPVYVVPGNRTTWTVSVPLPRVMFPEPLNEAMVSFRPPRSKVPLTVTALLEDKLALSVREMAPELINVGPMYPPKVLLF